MCIEHERDWGVYDYRFVAFCYALEMLRYQAMFLILHLLDE